MNYLILGSGPAGVAAVEAIRSRDRQSLVSMVTRDHQPACSPVMRAYWLTGSLTDRRLLFRDEDWAERMKVNVITRAEAAAVQPLKKTVVLSDGRSCDYDRLLVATGAVPVSLRISGIGTRGVLSLRDLTEARQLVQREPRGIRIAILGGGFIGLNLACHLGMRGCRVVILEKMPRLAFRAFDDRVSRMVETLISDHGIRVRTGVEATEILSCGGRLTGLRLSGGEKIECDFLFQAVGVRPNTSFLKGAGMDSENGLVVHDDMRINIPEIFAAGDACLTRDAITGEVFNNAIWPAAVRQGAVAGENMAGGRKKYRYSFPHNAMNLFGFRIHSAGHPYLKDSEGIESKIRRTGDSYRKVLLRDGKLIGFLLAGDVTGSGVLMGMMKRGAPIQGENFLCAEKMYTGPDRRFPGAKFFPTGWQ